jgi:hypothetical protein
MSGITLTLVSSATLDEETFIRLEKLSRKAANDSLRTHGAHLSDDQFDSLAVHLLALGLRAYERYDVSLAGGVSRETHSFRAMRGYRQGRFTEGPYVDWLRTHIRDSRFEPAGSSQVTETGTLPEHEVYEEPRLEHIVESYAAGLSDREAWTLRHVASAIATGNTLLEVVEGLLGDLADALSPLVGDQRRPQVMGTDLSSFEDLFSDWLKEAA